MGAIKVDGAVICVSDGADEWIGQVSSKTIDSRPEPAVAIQVAAPWYVSKRTRGGLKGLADESLMPSGIKMIFKVIELWDLD